MSARSFPTVTGTGLSACDGGSHGIEMLHGGADLQELFAARHRVFVDEMHYVAPIPAERLFDRHDFESRTWNIVVSCANRIVAGIRLIDASTGPTELEALFRFADHLLPDARPAAGSMFFVEANHRATPGLLSILLDRFHALAWDEGFTHVFGAVAPAGERALLRRGYRSLTQRFFHPAKGLWVMPVILDVLHDPRLSENLP